MKVQSRIIKLLYCRLLAENHEHVTFKSNLYLVSSAINSDACFHLVNEDSELWVNILNYVLIFLTEFR